MGNTSGAKLNRERILSLIKNRGLSQRKLAAAAQVKEQTISNLLLGKRGTKGDTLIRIAEALGTSPEYIIEDPPEDFLLKSRDVAHLSITHLKSSPAFSVLRLAGYEFIAEYVDGYASEDSVASRLEKHAAVSAVIKDPELPDPAWLDFADRIYKIRTPGGREVYITEANFRDIEAMISSLADTVMRNMMRPMDSPPPESSKLPNRES